MTIKSFPLEIVDFLNQSQININLLSIIHPFTCPHESDGVIYENGIANFSQATHATEGGKRGILIATEDGWACPYCKYKRSTHFGVIPKEVDAYSEPSFFQMKHGIENKHLINRIDAIISDYIKLYNLRKTSIYQGFDENQKSKRIWRLVEVMLGSLRRKKMQMQGVNISPKKEIISIDSDWKSNDIEKPEDGVEVFILWQEQPDWNDDTPTQIGHFSGGITNPGHEGFGCNVWVCVGAYSNGSFLSLGGTVTHWREIPKPAKLKEHPNAPATVKFNHLPLGAKFSYIGSKDVWIVLERFDCGRIAQWSGNILQFTGQKVRSAANSPEETERLRVVLIE